MSLWVTLGVILIGFILEVVIALVLPLDNPGDALWFCALKAMTVGTLVMGFNGVTDDRHGKKFLRGVVWTLLVVLTVFHLRNWIFFFFL